MRDFHVILQMLPLLTFMNILKFPLHLLGVERSKSMEKAREKPEKISQSVAFFLVSLHCSNSIYFSKQDSMTKEPNHLFFLFFFIFKLENLFIHNFFMPVGQGKTLNDLIYCEEH